VTTEEAVAALNEIKGTEPEMDHINAEKILLLIVPPEVALAFDNLQERADWWAYA
jgi:hypothetical protein